MVADGHLTDIPIESVYSGVVSLHGLRIVFFLAELYGLESWTADIGNAYLEAKTKEKIYIVAGPDFGKPKKYIEKMDENYKRLFVAKVKSTYRSPLEKGDHPEMDTSDFLGDSVTQLYQPLVGSLQWALSLSRFDTATAVMTLSSFRVAPRVGHLERAKRVVCYLAQFSHAKLRFRTLEPDYSSIPDNTYDWAHSVYGDIEEDIPNDIPTPLGKFVRITHYVDANLYHDMLTGRSVTGILDFLNQTPIEWYSKKQATVETATYGSEFVASRTCVERDIDLRTLLRYLGVPIRKLLLCLETMNQWPTVRQHHMPSYINGIRHCHFIVFGKQLLPRSFDTITSEVRTIQLTFSVNTGVTIKYGRCSIVFCSGQETLSLCSNSLELKWMGSKITCSCDNMGSDNFNERVLSRSIWILWILDLVESRTYHGRTEGWRMIELVVYVELTF